ncbi:MAG: hypothetical protein DRN24_06755, partial [Thermoplasmata archaeon]
KTLRYVNRFFIIGIVVVFLFTTATSAFEIYQTIEKNKDIETITLDFSFSKPKLEKIKIKNKIFDRVTIDSLQNTYGLNKPSLPVKPVKILLPQGRNVKNIEVYTSNKISLGKGFNIETGGNLVPLTDTYMMRSRDKFSSVSQGIGYTIMSKGFNSLYQNIGVYIYRGFSILHVNIYPVQYDIETGELSFFNDVKLVVETEESQVYKAFRGFPRDYKIVRDIVDNPSCLDTYKPVSMGRSYSIETHEYVIITSEKFKNANGEYTFQDLMYDKLLKGLNPKIVTVEEIMNNPEYGVFGSWGDGNSENPFYQSEITGNLELFDDKPARIRNFIRYAYMEWGTDYVLLGGDADVINPEDNIIPLRGLFANESGLPLTSTFSPSEEEDDIPSDVYYACLDGNFNYDCDMHFGESADRNDVNSIDEADLYAEVWVGRACVDSKEEISNFVMKTLKYEEMGKDPYLSKILFVGEDLGTSFYTRWGGDYKDLIESYVPSQYNLTKLYDRDHEYNDWSPQEFFDLLVTNPVQIINHDGHGNEDYMLKVYGSDIRLLENEKPFFIYSHSCLTGAFDNYNCWSGYVSGDCIAEILTCEIPYGAYACILNARFGLGSEDSIESPSGAYDSSFYKALFTENIRQLGPANHYSKQDNIWRIDENGYRWCYYQTNLFGDPELSIRGPNDVSPEKPSKPVGTTRGKPGEEYTYTTAAVDPDGDDLYYWFDWGDGTYSGWLGPYQSGETANGSHKWSDRGEYMVRVKAKNTKGLQSEWSDPLSINMPRGRGLYRFLLLRFLDGFSYLFDVSI